MRGVLAFLLLAALCFALLVTRPETDGWSAQEIALGLAAIGAALGARMAWRRRDR